MNCDEVRGQLSAYADGELPPESANCLRLHLAACTACRLMLAEHDRLWDLMQGLDSMEPPPDFGARVRERIEEGLMPAAARSMSKVWAVGAAAAAVLAAFGLFAALSGPGPAPDAGRAFSADEAAADARDERALLAEMDAYPGFLDLLSGLDVAAEKDVDIEILESMEILDDSAMPDAEEFGMEETALIPEEDGNDWTD